VIFLWILHSTAVIKSTASLPLGPIGDIHPIALNHLKWFNTDGLVTERASSP